MRDILSDPAFFADVKKEYCEHILNYPFLARDKCQKHEDFKNQTGLNAPWLLSVDLAVESYGLCYEELDDLIGQAKDLGCYVFLFHASYSARIVRDLKQLIASHHDCLFIISLWQESVLADDLLGYKNVIWSVDVTSGIPDPLFMKLKEAGAFFGANCMYDRQNIEQLSRERFVDDLVRRGVKYLVYHPYFPIGEQVSVKELPRPKQRLALYEKQKQYAKSKPILIFDELSNDQMNCPGGGRGVLHVSGKGDVRMCRALPYCGGNVREKSLRSIIQAPFTALFQNSVPFTNHPLRHCPLLDAPLDYKQLVQKTKAYADEDFPFESLYHMTQKMQSHAVHWKDALQEE